MAYTSVIPVRRLDRAVKYVMNIEKTTAVSLQDALDYAANRDKTEQSCWQRNITILFCRKFKISNIYFYII